MTSDFEKSLRDLRDLKREKREKYGEPCKLCVKLLPKANPSILLPGQTCKIHKHRDHRKRTEENQYLKKDK